MKSPEQEHAPGGPAPEWMDARVEAYLDGALPPGEAAAFERRLAEAPRWQRAVRRARMVQRGLHALPAPACPPGVTRAVLREARSTDRRSTDRRSARSPARAPRRPAPPRTERRRGAAARWWQPALAMGALLALVLAAALLGRTPPPPAERFTQAEVERATAEAEWTLAFLSGVARQTGTTVQEDVLEARVAAPVREAVAPAFGDETDGRPNASFDDSDEKL